jgi:hypothetical protein
MSFLTCRECFHKNMLGYNTDLETVIIDGLQEWYVRALSHMAELSHYQTQPN